MSKPEPKTSRVPSAPSAWALVGHAPSLMRDPAGFLAACRDSGHDLVELRLGPRRALLLCKAAVVNRVLAEQAEDYGKGGPFWDAMRPILGNGVGTCDGDEHKRARRLLRPAFNRAAVNGYSEMIDDSASVLAESWRPGQPVRVAAEMMAFTSRITVRALLPTIDEAEVERFVRMMPILTEGAFYQLVLPSFAQLLPTAHNRLYQKTRAEARDAVARLVKQARAVDEQAGQCPAHQGHGLLASAIVTGRQEELPPFTDEELADQVMTVLFAGIETSANVLSWALCLLASHPETADRIAEDTEGEVVHRVIAETMRLYPPGWIFSRNSTRPVELSGHHLPAGTDFIISPFLLHREPRVFDRPEQFDPDRWRDMDPDVKRSYLPFGLGPRRCLGELLANAEMVAALTTLCRRWRFSLPEGRTVVPRFRSVLIPHGLELDVHPR
ncbi:cytochrome P450 [Kutzneria kofuensis]|uniref:Pentalenene oxygenase n=1 Tax=Kutzneria kofuensis TaxID=103725 RepID=A0A7W9KMZ7_9PSEU|nr:cytochrome P450 [Kutzneria kofuensis]MBB5895437.1 pentalenene oxygenase [Kutzneria kofuensis]